jgi:cysteine desulfurase
MIYFDANATTGVSPDVLDAYLSAISLGPLNPSSAHSGGDVARELLRDAREAIVNAIGAAEKLDEASYADPDSVFFTSGGTEGNNIVINGFATKPGAVVGCSSVEHPSVLEAVRAKGGFEVGVDAEGRIDFASLEMNIKKIVSSNNILFCLQAANSETGVLQDLDAVARLCRSLGVRILVDGAQAFGRCPIPFSLIDAFTFSGHKLHAPQGTGALILSEDFADSLPETIFGGGQERGLRSGTQNVAGIAALAAAVKLRFNDFSTYVEHVAALRREFETNVLQSIPHAKVIGSTVERLPNTSNIMFPGADAMTMLAQLDGEGVICSNGSACSSMKPSPSHVLTAMGMSEKEAFSCLRFSFSATNTMDEVVEAAGRIESVYRTVKALNDR